MQTMPPRKRNLFPYAQADSFKVMRISIEHPIAHKPYVTGLLFYDLDGQNLVLRDASHRPSSSHSSRGSGFVARSTRG